ncbi:recombination protein NinB [Stenotrophomonas sp. 278]|uniref:recombination protein NinB n=1 Tax=Stenotrophomonas sp. 278 TaxID=2479851 RepID=UPI000F66A25C|nr:recombination protein NinB [Stenotrophomonas sp. 278]RRU17840.1 NinB family protein [Stenotrophomonas sp. 278]
MADKRLFALRHDNPRRPLVMDSAISEIRHRVAAGEDFDVTVSEPKRTLAENALLHVLITELAGQLEWAGKKRDAETWKRLLVAAWMRAEGKPIEILPALDGNGVELIPVRTSGLGKKACADLIEFIYAWGAEQGIRWVAYDRSAA